jgi:hypothetical protein
VQPGDDAGGGRVLEPERTTDDDGQLTDPGEGLFELGHRQVVAAGLDEGYVRDGIHRLNVARHALSVRKGDLHPGFTADDVFVCDQQAIGGVGDAAAGAGRGDDGGDGWCDTGHQIRD